MYYFFSSEQIRVMFDKELSSLEVIFSYTEENSFSDDADEKCYNGYRDQASAERRDLVPERCRS